MAALCQYCNSHENKYAGLEGEDGEFVAIVVSHLRDNGALSESLGCCMDTGSFVGKVVVHGM